MFPHPLQRKQDWISRCSKCKILGWTVTSCVHFSCNEYPTNRNANPIIAYLFLFVIGRSDGFCFYVNEFAKWFGDDFDKLDIVTTFNLVYNAAIMVDAGIGYAVTIDKIANTSENSSLCFRPLEPRLDSGLNIVWKKYQVFSSAAEIFLERLWQDFDEKTANDR